MKTDGRLAVPAAAGWALLAVFLAAPAALPWAAGGCWLLAIGSLMVTRGHLRYRRMLLTAALCATLAGLMLTAAALAAPVRWPGALLEASETGAVVRGLATTTESVYPGADRFTATLTEGTVAGQQFTGSVPVLVFGAVEAPTGIGAELQLIGSLGGADAAGSVAFLFFLDGAASVERAPPWALQATGGLRDGFRTVATSLPGDGGDLLPGLAIGDTRAVDDTLDSAMKASALSHLTAVSGANCAVIIGLVVFGGAAVGLPRGMRITLALAVLVGFVVLVTPEPSVLRASVMAALVLTALASGRPVRGLPILALAVTVLLVVDPWLSRNFAFVLSVCASAGLLLLAAPLARVLTRWMPLPLALVVAVPAAAQLACQPVLILLNPSIPTYGVVANILAAPAAPLATVLGLVACVTIPVAPVLGALVAQVAWLPSGWIAAAATLLLIIAAYLGTVGGEQTRRRLSPPADWIVAACDVGQGDAMLVRSQDRVALIDTGPDPALLEYCLSTLGVARIDLLVLTHFDLDHVGGAGAVAGRVDQLLVGPSAGPDDDRVVQHLRDAGAAVEQVGRGNAGSLGELGWRVLWPPDPADVEPGNDASVVVEFLPPEECISGCFSGVFLGDLGEEAQTRMLAGAALGEVDLVKVAHHGSRDQNGRLYQRLGATVGLVGVGAGNDYGHPTRQTLDLLRSTGTEVVRTDLSGLSLLSLRDGDLHLWTEHSRADAGAVAGGE